MKIDNIIAVINEDVKADTNDDTILIHPDIYETLTVPAGILCYRDQVVNTIQQVTGFELEKADLLRKVMASKKLVSLEVMMVPFLAGAKDLVESY